MHSADASPPDAPARQLRDSLARGLRTEPTVRLAWLFGSRARGTERRDSDVDVAVLVDDACADGPGALKDSYFRLIPAMTGAVRSDLIDLVILNHAPRSCDTGSSGTVSCCTHAPTRSAYASCTARSGNTSTSNHGCASRRDC